MLLPREERRGFFEELDWLAVASPSREESVSGADLLEPFPAGAVSGTSDRAWLDGVESDLLPKRFFSKTKIQLSGIEGT